MTAIKLAVFDMAGTTVDEDNVVYKTLQKSIVNAGYEMSLDHVLLHGAGKEKHQAIKDSLAAKGHTGVDSLAIFNSFKKNLDAAYQALEVKTFAGMEDLFASLRQKGIKIALNTGYSSRIATLLLGKLGWQQGLDYDTLVTADDVKNGRPEPDMILLAMERTGVVDNAATLKAGDSAIDIEEGKKAGCGITVGVTTGAQTRDQLGQAQPTYVVDSLTEMLDFIE